MISHLSEGDTRPAIGTRVVTETFFEIPIYEGESREGYVYEMENSHLGERFAEDCVITKTSVLGHARTYQVYSQPEGFKQRGTVVGYASATGSELILIELQPCGSRIFLGSAEIDSLPALEQLAEVAEGDLK